MLPKLGKDCILQSSEMEEFKFGLYLICGWKIKKKKKKELKQEISGGAWVVQSDKCMASAQVMIPRCGNQAPHWTLGLRESVSPSPSACPFLVCSVK